MKLNISQIVSNSGDPIIESETVKAYQALLNGNKKRAIKLLCKLHEEIYWSGIRNITTDIIVAQIYKERGILKPSRTADSDPDIVKEAVARRVRDHIETAKDIIENGLRLKPRGQMEGGTFRLLDGYNRAALLIAMGNSEIDVG